MQESVQGRTPELAGREPREGDSTRVTQQEAAEPRQPGVSSSHYIKPNHPGRASAASFQSHRI